MKFNYGITIYNKESIIKDVLDGVKRSMGPDSHIYPNLDGCTDRSEQFIDEWIVENSMQGRVTKLHTADVHEILSINNIMQNAVPAEGDGYLVVLQDDVVLRDPALEHNIETLYRFIKENYNLKIGNMTFRHGVVSNFDHTYQCLGQHSLIEAITGIGFSDRPLRLGEVVERISTIRSPQCFSFDVVRTVGIQDPALAPFNFDDYDYSIRCIQAGYRNFVMAVNCYSDPNKGGMRCNEQPLFDVASKRNSQYLGKKHYDFLTKTTPLYLPEPFYVPGIVIDRAEDARITAEYADRRHRYFNGGTIHF